MKKKIIFWVDGNLSTFCILKKESFFFEVKSNSLGLNVDNKINAISNKIII